MQVKEENGNYICLKHNQMILLVVLDNRVLPENQMLCNICMNENRLPLNQVLSVQQAKEMLKEKFIKQKERKEERINKQLEKLRLLQQNMIELRTQLQENIDIIDRMIHKWTHELSNSISKESIDLIQGLQLLQQKEIDRQIKYHNLINNNRYQIRNQIQQQEEICYAIAFNNTGSIMVAGSDKNIKVYQFEKGKITLLTELQGQGNMITCLLFSKNNQWFISADGDWWQENNLKCWKQGKNNTEWLYNQGEQKHRNIIRSIILNNDENSLISCSGDLQIIVWGVNYENNRIDYQYTLQNKHTDRGQNGRWVYQNSITLSIYLSRFRFIGQTQLLVQQDGKGFTNVFEVVNQQFKEQKDLQITLKDPNEDSDYRYFPIIYNKSKEIIILKSHKFIYIIKKQSNGYFKVESQPIDCETRNNFGNLIENGQYLVIWDGKRKEFKVYKINYE